MERVTLVHCQDADKAHVHNPGAFTHVGHHQHTICVCSALVFLAREFVCGILLHQLGQVTDRTGGSLAGIRILRKPHRAHGIATTLEWISPRDVPRAVRVLKRLTNL